MKHLPPLAERLSRRLLEESRRVAAFVERRGVWLLVGWTCLCLLGGLFCAAVFFHQYPQFAQDHRIPALMAPSLTIAAAPWLAWFLASRAYPKGAQLRQPAIRLATLGRWEAIGANPQQQRNEQAFEGFLVSLAMGMLLSMIMRLVTYYLAIPAMPPGAPEWGFAAFRIMTFDVALLSFMYMACFTMALRRAPLFPRMLVVTWCYDLLMQLAIARYIAEAGELPALVAGPFADLLGGNVRKVLLSMVIWMPYLMLSTRVNALFRARVRVRA